MKMFNDFSLQSFLKNTLETLNFTNPTEIQAKTLPILLSPEKIDFHGQAQTGTGKTLAFGLPLINNIDPQDKSTQALVVAPTRELVVQIYQSLKPFAQSGNISIAPIYGGVSIEAQLKELKRGIQVVIGTPGRLNDHLRRKSLVLKNTKTLVLDEADIMLDMGFKEEIDEILEHMPKNRSIWLFSATVKSGINDIMKSHMKSPVSVRVSKENVGSSNTEQFYCIVPKKNRFEALMRFITANPSFYGFIFCQTKIETAEVADKLSVRGYNANALHGDLSQANRNRVIKDFKDKKFSILVATDVAARGIDVPDITHVINYQLPEDSESYVHRIGRTGRAGKDGVAITLIARHEVSIIGTIQRRFNVKINPIEIPSLDNIYENQIKLAENFITNSSVIAEKKPYMNRLQGILDRYSSQEIHGAMLTLLEEKFFKAIDDTPLITTSHTANGSSGNDDIVELMINVGSQDGVEKRDILHYLMQDRALHKDDIGKIRVIKKRSFIKVPADKTENIIACLKGKNIKGRRIFVSYMTS
jgi:ATP-dependent RNA helicase DeaD